MSRDIHIINYDHIFLKHISQYFFILVKTLPNFASQDTFFGRVIYRDRGNQPTNPSKTGVGIESPDIGQARGNDLGSLAAAAVSWLRCCWVCCGLLVPMYKTSFLLIGRLRPVGTVSQMCLHVWKTHFPYICT